MFNVYNMHNVYHMFNVNNLYNFIMRMMCIMYILSDYAMGERNGEKEKIQRKYCIINIGTDESS